MKFDNFNFIATMVANMTRLNIILMCEHLKSLGATEKKVKNNDDFVIQE